MKVRRVATLTAAALLSAVVSATAQTVNVSTLAIGGNRASTGLGHSQTIVGNQYGVFAAYVYDNDVNNTQTQWRLVRSVDGGSSWITLYESCPSVQSGCPGGAPVIETDRDGNIYLIYSDVNTNHAYFLRFLAATNYTNPRVLTLPDGAAQKFSAVIDQSRGRIYYAATNFNPAPPTDSGTTLWFFTIPLDGSSYSSVRLTQPATNNTVDGHYPHLYLDEHDHLYAAWTTSPGTPGSVYYSMHFMRSRDGGTNWETLTGTAIILPVVADETGPAHEINPPGERGTHVWLWTMIVKQGKAHFWYRAFDVSGHPMHYVRFDTVSGEREQDTMPAWGGTNYSISAEHGDCSTRRERLDGTIYCVSTTAGTNDRLAAVVTTDNGQTWQDFAATNPIPGCDEQCHYWIGTARQIDENSVILGLSTQNNGQIGPTTLNFFSVPVPTPSLERFPAWSWAASSAYEYYPAYYAVDSDPGTAWLASASVSPANNSAWIQLDLGDVKDVRRVVWTGSWGRSPAHYTLSASRDGVHWTTVNTRTDDYEVMNGEELVFLSARYLRLATTKVGNGVGYGLLLFDFAAIGVEPPATSRLFTYAAHGDSQAVGYPATNAIDGDPNTLFLTTLTAQTSNNNAWFWIDLGSAQPITRLKWLGGAWGGALSPYPAHSPADYAIWVSHDFVTWTILKTQTSPTGVITGDELIAATARYVLLVTTKVHDGTEWAQGFFEFWVEH